MCLIYSAVADHILELGCRGLNTGSGMTLNKLPNFSKPQFPHL